ncbi:MAG: sulfatase family protein [Phycisphaerae bacterium]
MDNQHDAQESRRVFLKAGVGALGALTLSQVPSESMAAAPGQSPHRPNFVFFLGEGVRWDEYSCMGNAIIRTPHMDRIAREGMIFRNAFVVNALCAPSRAIILTGLYSHTTGVLDNSQTTGELSLPGQVIPKDIPLLSDMLRKAGYEVAMFGRANVDVEDRYWDYYFGFRGWIWDYNKPILRECVAGQWSAPRQYDGYVDDLVTTRAVEWIEKKHEKPYCAFVWFNAPHAPFYRPRRLLDLYNGVKIPTPSTFNDDLKQPPYPGKPRDCAISLARNKIGTTVNGYVDPRTLEELVKNHYAGVVDNDDNVGRVVSALEKTGTLDDTAIIISSDHGFFLGEWRMYDKRFMYEPSIRVALMVRYPRMVKAGSVCEHMALNIDFVPTILELAGVAVPSAVQGRSLVPLLQGESPGDWRKDWLYEYYEYPWDEHVRPHRGVRTERYKLIHFYAMPQYPDFQDQFELYDLQEDPGELHNLYGKPRYHALAQQLKQRIDELRRQTHDHTNDAAT